MYIRTRAQALIIEDGHVLLARHHDLTINQVYWCLPGGGVEAGETPDQAAVRELKEEANLDIRIQAKIGELALPGVTQGYVRGVTYLADIAGGDLQLGHDPEQVDWEDKFLQEIRWIPIDEVWLPQIESILRLWTEPYPYLGLFELHAPTRMIGI
jgi:8-oxo-dGTP diphosphatase